MMYKLSKRSKGRLKGVNPQLVTLINMALEVSPIDFGIPEDGGLRSAGRQNMLFKEGVSKCDGFSDLSMHQSGNAFDFYAYVNGSASWDKVQLGILYGVFQTIANQMNIKIVWGGTFDSDTYNGWDMGHLEIDSV